MLLTCKSDEILSLSVLLRSSLMLILFVELHKVLLIIHLPLCIHACMSGRHLSKAWRPSIEVKVIEQCILKFTAFELGILYIESLTNFFLLLKG